MTATWWRRQPPVHSPITAQGLFAAVVTAGGDEDPRPAFAERLRVDHGADHVVLTDSGTAALRLAIRAAWIAAGRTGRVALPAYSCFDVATAGIGADVPLTLYDLDPRTLGPDPASLRVALDIGARVVVVAPLFGVPIDEDAVRSLTDPRGAILITDAAQGHGASWEGRPLGARAPVSTLSFGRGKGWTGGSGGAVLFRATGAWDACAAPLEEVGRLDELRGWSAAAAQWGLARPALFALPAALPMLHLGETRYHPPRAVHAIRRGAVRLLESTREAAEREAIQRRAHAEWFLQALPAHPWVTRIRVPSSGIAGWLRLPLLLRHGLPGFTDQRSARAAGIASGYPTSLALLPALAPLLHPTDRERSWSGAATLVEQLVTLPTHSGVTAAERQDLAGLLEAYAGRAPLRARS